jgi:selenoprotein W-related protein
MSKPALSIEYCPRCGWLLRAAWLAQELLTTFSDDVSAVALAPSAESGRFQIRAEDELVWCRKRDGGFPQPAELKRRVRDHICPDKPLGHSDRVERADAEHDS